MTAKRRTDELILTRLYDAPLSAVWDAWTDVEQVAKWWGPRGFTITTHSKDLRPGGNWRYTMHGPDGVDYPNVTYYHEVEPYRRLVYDHGATVDTPPLFRVTVLFTETPRGTKLDLTMKFASPEKAEESRKFIKRANGESTWDRLGEYLAHRATGKERFIINRSFAVPREKMFEMWTKPEHFTRWLPPTGAEMSFLRANIKPGGDGFYVMTFPDGLKMHGRVQYREINKPERIVYTQQFCDENEKPARHPMSPTWPEKMITVVMLTEEGPEQTRVTVTWEPEAASTPAEIETFVKGRAGMTQGWQGSFDKLDTLLGIADPA